MNGEEDSPLGCLVIFLIGGLIAGYLMGRDFNVEQWKQEAVSHGAAEFYLDQDNKRQWRWLDEKLESETEN